MSLVLADTSVWVELLRGAKSAAAEDLERLLAKGLVCTHPVVKAELLSGVGSDQEYGVLELDLAALRVLEDPPGLWDAVAWARCRLARGGHQAAIADLLLAATAAHHRREIFTLDAGFERIKAVLPFQLFRPPRR